MVTRSLADWLRWQESLHPRSIDLGLDRIQRVLARLDVRPPPGRVITVAGTNGKGSTVTLLQDFMRAAGSCPGLYTSPHLVSYNERIRINGAVISDSALLCAFEQVERARADIPLTYFEFGTLAAFVGFSNAGCDVWILEVGLGGRLDAVNALDPDLSLITTIALDHQDWLGDTVEAIAAEKAGILRPGRPAIYGDEPVPAAILERAREIGASLEIAGTDFRYARDASPDATASCRWSWHRSAIDLTRLEAPRHWSAAQFRNASLALAALTHVRPDMLTDIPALNEVFARSRPDGRFQVIQREHEWILDVAHNPQAATVLRAQLETLPPAGTTTIVIALLADKVVTPFVAELAPVASRWIVSGIDDPRASTLERMVREMVAAGLARIESARSPFEAFELARQVTPRGQRIVVCGSFRIVAPALQWLGLY